MQVLVNQGNVPMQHTTAQHRGCTIDHIVTHGVHAPVTSLCVLHSWDMSDNYPVVVTLPVGTIQVCPPVPAADGAAH